MLAKPTQISPSAFAEHQLERLLEIPQPPKTIWLQGNPPPPNYTLLAIVGSRKYTTYGKHVVEDLVAGLHPYAVGIVSGLARGIDGLAHQAALAAELYTLAIPGSGLDHSVLYPAQHRSLADKILSAGGGLLSELSPMTKAAKWTFPQRNRLMAGLSHATLLVEAGERSGTLITARLATDYDRELLVVPGSIFSPNSHGVHQFLKLGATPVTNSSDIAEALHLTQTTKNSTMSIPELTETEQILLSHLTHPTDIDTLVGTTHLSISDISTTLMALEIKGYVHVTNGLYQARI